MIEDIVGDETGVGLANDWVLALVVLGAGGGRAELERVAGHYGGALREYYVAGCIEGCCYA